MHQKAGIRGTGSRNKLDSPQGVVGWCPKQGNGARVHNRGYRDDAGEEKMFFCFGLNGGARGWLESQGFGILKGNGGRTFRARGGKTQK